MTANSRKLYYMLEETDLEYRIHPVNIGQDVAVNIIEGATAVILPAGDAAALNLR